MSNTYKHNDEVPNDVLCKRLDELSNAVTKGREEVLKEFTMRIPAELDHDADLVIYEASKRIRNNEKQQQLDRAQQQFTGYTYGRKGSSLIDLVNGMGLTNTEWVKLKKEYELDLEDYEIEFLNDYFSISN